MSLASNYKNDLILDTFIPPTQDQRAALINEQNSVGGDSFLGNVADSVQVGLNLFSPTQNLVKSAVGRIQFPADPNYVQPKSDTPEFEEAVAGLPPDRWEQLFNGVRSKDQLEWKKQNTLEELDASRRLAENGWGGIATVVGVSILDPVSLATVLLTGGVPQVIQAGRALRAGAAATRLAQAGKFGAIAAAENVAIDSTLFMTRETMETTDLLYGLVGGFAIGAGIGAAIKPRRILADLDVERIVNRALSGDNGDIAEASIPRSVGAAQADFNAAAQRSLTDALGDELGGKIGAVRTDTGLVSRSLNKLRLGYAGRLDRHENPVIRGIGRLMFNNNLETQNEAAAELVAKTIKTQSKVRFWRGANPAIRDAMENVPALQRSEAAQALFKEATLKKRLGQFDDTPAGRIAAAFRDAVNHAAGEAKKHKVKGFDGFELDDLYVNRVWDLDSVDTLIGVHSANTIAELIAGAIRGSADITQKKANLIAKGMLKNFMDRGNGITDDFVLRMNDPEELERVMKKAGIGDDEIEDVLESVRGFKSSGEGKISQFRKRLSLDETFKMKMPNGEVVAVSDLFENNAAILMEMYSNSVGGAAGMARVGFKSRSDFEKAIEFAKRQGGVKEQHVEMLEDAYRSIRGESLINYDRKGNMMGLMAREMAFLAQSGDFGVAQFPEMLVTLHYGGLELMMESIPELKSMFTRAKSGKISNAAADEFELLTGVGSDPLIHTNATRFEPVDAGGAINQRGVLGATEPARHALRKTAGYISGLAPATTFMQRLVGRFIGRRMVNHVMGTGKGYTKKQMNIMFPDKKRLSAIEDQIKKHSSSVDGIPELNLAKWDTEARDDFIFAMKKEADRLVVVPDLGSSLPEQMTSEVVKVLTQFSTFGIISHEKILLAGIKHMDAERVMQLLFSAFGGALGYMVKVQKASIGRDDREEYLEERLTLENMAYAAASRSSYSGIIPQTAEGFAELTGFSKYPFDVGLSGTPVGGVLGGLATIPASLSDLNLSPSELDKMQRAVPFGQAVGMQQIIGLLRNELEPDE